MLYTICYKQGVIYILLALTYFVHMFFMLLQEDVFKKVRWQMIDL